MRLTGLELRAYRRFTSEDLDLSEPLIALTGPNEAGKTSLLRAIRLLEPDEAVDPRDMTRGSNLAADHELVRGLYRLDEDDKSAIRHLHDAEQVQHFVIARRVDGSIATGIRPTPTRSHRPLDEAVRSLTKAAKKVASLRRAPVPPPVIEALEFGAKRLEEYRGAGWNDDSTDGTLADIRDALQTALDDNELSNSATESLSTAIAAVNSAMQARQGEHPHAAMRHLLYERRPRIIPFPDSERDLRASYDLSTDAESPPGALSNIAALARLSLREVRDARDVGDYGRVEGLLDAANEQLRIALSNWSQSSLTLRLRMDENILRLLVTTPDRSWLTEITERSDGLRSYIALVGAIAWARGTTSSQRPTLLLLDEAEQHLHYDAQADLVEVLSSGRLAHQVVYTTHPAGCLPEDLGAAVRVILPAADSERSRIQNWFWEKGPGFSPLLLGMGASSLAFSSARRAVLTEGASDTIALPSLLREALKTQRLGYQVAPGLAEVGRAAARELDLEAARVVYLVDGDSAGGGITQKLKTAGVHNDDIVVLGGDSSGMTLEDLLSPTAFRAAARAALRRSGSTSTLGGIPAPRSGRAAALQKACADAGIAPPSKRVLAQEIVLQARESSVLSVHGSHLLQQLHATIAGRLGLPQ